MNDVVFVPHTCILASPIVHDLGQRPSCHCTDPTADRVTHRGVEDVPDRDSITVEENDGIADPAV